MLLCGRQFCTSGRVAATAERSDPEVLESANPAKCVICSVGALAVAALFVE